MKHVNYNELRTLMPHIRENFITGTQIYRDQAHPVRYENQSIQDLYAGLIKHHGGVREGYMKKTRQERAELALRGSSGTWR